MRMTLQIYLVFCPDIWFLDDISIDDSIDSRALRHAVANEIKEFKPQFTGTVVDRFVVSILFFRYRARSAKYLNANN